MREKLFLVSRLGISLIRMPAKDSSEAEDQAMQDIHDCNRKQDVSGKEPYEGAQGDQ